MPATYMSRSCSFRERQKSRTPRTLGYFYPVILSVRQFDDSGAFAQGLVARYICPIFNCSLCYCFFTNLYLTVPLRRERSTSTTLWQFGHFSSITPVVIVTLSKIRQPQFLHLTIIFCSNVFTARSPPGKQIPNQKDYQDTPFSKDRAVSFVWQEPFWNTPKNPQVRQTFYIRPESISC